MKIFKTRAELTAYLNKFKEQRRIIGFIPTMGALHKGHISLIEAAKENCDIIVCSIFVNPTQFNDLADLAKYPRTIEEDIRMIKPICDVLFMPEVNEMYPANEKWDIDLGPLESFLEGQYRPGHYKGVAQIVYKLFETVKPDKAFFGQKDFQQFKIIERMVSIFNLHMQLVMCPIIREADGLAMSSRNARLTASEHHDALILSKALFQAQEQFRTSTLKNLKEAAIKMLKESKGINLEYFEICDTESFDIADEADGQKLVALVAAKVGNTRLIDNIILN